MSTYAELAEGSAEPLNYIPPNLIDQLTNEVRHLDRTPGTRTHIQRWALTCDLITGCRTLYEIRQVVRRHDAEGNREAVDEILRFLLQAGADGDQLAYRCLFDMFANLAIYVSFGESRRQLFSFDELREDAMYALWETIATYPLQRRPTKVAANLKMEIVKRLSRSSRDRSTVRNAEVPTEVTDTTLATSGSLVYRKGGGSTGGAPAGAVDEILEVIAWGLDAGAITQDHAALLTRVYCTGDSRQAAYEEGLSWPALRQRCSRATRALAAAVQQAISEDQYTLDRTSHVSAN